MGSPVCVVVGVGPGNGIAIAKKFSDQGYQVALCSRNESNLKQYSSEIKGSRAYSYDVQDIEAPKRVFEAIARDMGAVDTLIYNAGTGGFLNIEEATVENLQDAWEVNTRGLFLAVQEVIPDMLLAESGNIVVIGATGSVKGGPNSAPFSSAKAGQRGLAQSMAKHLGPKKIHVSYVVLDGVVNSQRDSSGYPSDFFMNPSGIADSVYFLTQQPTQAWTFELDLRAYTEKW
jgi:NADP-dependent 3-hydroxy acid dehydrogenase YdfG